MRYFFLILLMGITAMRAEAQLSDEEVLRAMDRIELGLTPDMPAISSHYAGDGIEVHPGSFLEDGRREFLCIVPLRRGEKEDKIAFVAWREEAGKELNASDWYALRFNDIRTLDIQSDGMQEVLVHVSVEGNRQSQEVWRIYSLEDDVPEVLFHSKGFTLFGRSLEHMQAGTQIARRVSIRFEDIDGDGDLDIIETAVDDYFQFDDRNVNGEFEPMAQAVLPQLQEVETVWEWKKGRYIPVADASGDEE